MDLVWKIYRDMNSFEWDRKYWDTRRKKVLNKNARANVCFGDDGSEPDYERKKGRIVGYDSVPSLECVKRQLRDQISKHIKVYLINWDVNRLYMI